MRRILVLGYDKRSRYLYRLLLDDKLFDQVDFYEPESFDFSIAAKNDYDTVILPIPTKTLDNNVLKGYTIRLDDIINQWKSAKFVCAEIAENDALIGINKLSLLKQNDFILKNAYLTAKAAVKIAFQKNNYAGSTCMVVGNGRIGRYLCDMLKEHKCQIVLATKNYQDLGCLSKYKNCIDYKDISKYLAECDVVFNTAPYNYFTYDELNEYSGVYLELASKPYGFEYNADNLPKSVQMCPSLPGKYYPKEAAKIIYDSIYEFVAKG